MTFMGDEVIVGEIIIYHEKEENFHEWPNGKLVRHVCR
jgi:hypothetical protein